MQAFAPLFPGPRQERWHFLLADTPKNALVALGSESLLAAEACGVVSALRSENGHAKEENASEGEQALGWCGSVWSGTVAGCGVL